MKKTLPKKQESGSPRRFTQIISSRRSGKILIIFTLWAILFGCAVVYFINRSGLLCERRYAELRLDDIQLCMFSGVSRHIINPYYIGIESVLLVRASSPNTGFNECFWVDLNEFAVTVDKKDISQVNLCSDESHSISIEKKK